jgi:hypothetical protein
MVFQKTICALGTQKSGSNKDFRNSRKYKFYVEQTIIDKTTPCARPIIAPVRDYCDKGTVTEVLDSSMSAAIIGGVEITRLGQGEANC